MFDEAFKKCDLDERALILDQMSGALAPVRFDPLETDIAKLPLSFYPDYLFLIIKTLSGRDTIERYAVYKHDHHTVLDYTADTILSLNKDIPITLSHDTVLDYIGFYLRCVRGRHGFFHLVQSVNDIKWKESPPDHARRSVSDMIIPLTLQKSNDDGFQCRATVVFENGLFACDIGVDYKGTVTITNQDLLIQDLPIYDSSFDGA